jgi:hypothetical protein
MTGYQTIKTMLHDALKQGKNVYFFAGENNIRIIGITKGGKACTMGGNHITWTEENSARFYIG